MPDDSTNTMIGACIDHTYRYAFASRHFDQKNSSHLQLATSGGVSEHPYFFQGRLIQPRAAAQALRVLTKVVGSRFHMPPAMLRRVLAQSDPVVTSGGGLLRFEGFSACCSAYARVDLTPDAYEGVAVGQGTTNVDFNAPMRAALAQVRDGERVSLAVGAEDVTLLRAAEQVVERKVPLPLRWLKGFAEVSAYQARMVPRAQLNKIEALGFLRSLPRSVTTRSVFWVVSTASGLRLAARETADGVRVAGLERLRLLEELAPLADGLRVFADPSGEASEWELRIGPIAFRLALTTEVCRGFSGEGQLLSVLACRERNGLLSQVRGMLKWQAELRAEEFAANWDVAPGAVRQALAVLGSRGLVGFDTARGAYFHRELPFDLSLVESMHPRLKSARQLVADGGVAVLRRSNIFAEADVRGSGVTHRVRLISEGARCTCPWFAKHQSARGPCKHILAVQIFCGEQSAETKTQKEKARIHGDSNN